MTIEFWIPIWVSLLLIILLIYGHVRRWKRERENK